MKVTINYYDSDALTVEEVVKQATHYHGKRADVKVMPDSTNPHDLVYFGIQCMVTHQQLGLLYNDKMGYQSSIQKLRKEALTKLEELLDQVIIDNEDKVAQ